MSVPNTSSATSTSSLANRAQFLAFRGVVAGLAALSWHRAVALGGTLGMLGYRPFGIRRAVVERQIAAAFPEIDEREVRRIARAAYVNLGRTAIETALAPTMDKHALLGLFEGVEGWELIEQAQAIGRGAILVTGHLGNWEIGGFYLAARGISIGAIVRRMANPLFDAYLTGTRSSMGVEVIHDADAVRRVPRAL